MSTLPNLGRGRPNEARRDAYQSDLREFCQRIQEIASTLDFSVGSRGWCYILENEGVISKGEFDRAERLIVECRKSGDLPLDICAVDEKRAADGVERLDGDIENETDAIFHYIATAHQYYRPISFWDDLPVYCEIAVEKGDLKSLFGQVAAEFHIPISNVGGWSDINSRVAMMRRFADWESKGKQCVLLYCGDHDPGGLRISDCLHSNFCELENAVGWHPAHLVVDRFGLNADFIEAQRLTWIDNLETGSGKRLDDPRHPEHNLKYVQDYLARFGARKCEANALVIRPQAGRELCRRAIERYLPRDAISRYESELATKRKELSEALAKRLNGAAESGDGT